MRDRNLTNAIIKEIEEVQTKLLKIEVIMEALTADLKTCTSTLVSEFIVNELAKQHNHRLAAEDYLKQLDNEWRESLDWQDSLENRRNK